MSRLVSTLPLLALASALAASSAFAAQSVPAPVDHSSQKTATATPPVIQPGDAACLRNTGSPASACQWSDAAIAAKNCGALARKIQRGDCKCWIPASASGIRRDQVVAGKFGQRRPSDTPC